MFLFLEFHALLRPKEALGLRRRHVSLPSDLILADENYLAVCIERPKSRATGGRIQHVVVRDAAVVLWVAWLVEGLHDDDPLFSFSGAVLRRRFQEVCEACSFGDFRFTPAGLRAGGPPSCSYAAGVPIDRL